MIKRTVNSLANKLLSDARRRAGRKGIEITARKLSPYNKFVLKQETDK